MSIRDKFTSGSQGKYAPTLTLSFRVLEQDSAEAAHHNFRDHCMLKAELGVMFRANSAEMNTAKQQAYERMAWTLYREQIGISQMLHAAILAGDREECLALVDQLENSMKW
jgi:hypothetical protein